MNAPAPVAQPPARPGRFMQWHKRILGFCLVVFAFELGLFLVIFPWLRVWGMNWVPVHSPDLSHVWMSRYFRGAVSGLGFLNIYIAVAEAGRQLRLLFNNRAAE